MSFAISEIPSPSLAEDTGNSLKTELPKVHVLNYKLVGLFEALVAIKRVFLAERGKNVRREMKGFWAVGILYRRSWTRLRATGTCGKDMIFHLAT
jgi:hypothetical protein